MERLYGMGRVLLASMLSLVACGLFVYIAMVTAGLWSEWPAVNWPATLVIPGMVVLWGLVIGTPIVIVLAAPAYALLLQAGRASFIAAAAIGIAPGLAMLPLARALAVPAMVTGLVVGLATHWMCRVRPGDSSRPEPG